MQLHVIDLDQHQQYKNQLMLQRQQNLQVHGKLLLSMVIL